MTNKDQSAKDSQKGIDFYTNVKDVAKAVKIKELGALTKDLQTLRSQLIGAVSVRVDPTEKYTRPLVEYIQSCTDCSSVIELWDYQTSTNIQNLECLVPDIISLVIRLCNTPILRSYGLQLIQTIMQRHMKSIYRGISSARIPQCQSSFRVLIAIASFNQTTARDLFQSFNFQAEGFTRACRYRQQKKGNNPNKYLFDLRTLYVQFVLAFLIHGDSEIKKQVLGVKGLLNGVFVPMEEDAYQLIEEILNVIYENLISDHRVPRFAKLSFFTPYILEKIAKIYGRQEPVPINSTETGIPANLVHHFLLSICTVPGIGVCLKHAGWYPPIRDNTLLTDSDKGEPLENKCLSKFILSLKPSDDMRQQELLLKILSACPELVQSYWKHVSSTFEVRLSSKWLGNATYLQKVIQLPVPSFYFGTTHLYPATPPKADMILDNILPTVFGRSISSKGLQHASALVRFTTTNILAAAFQKFIKVADEMEHVISVLEDVEVHQDKNTTTTTTTTTQDQQPGSLPSAQWRQCLNTVREELRRRLPEIQIIIKLHSEIFGKIDNTKKDDVEYQAQCEILQVSVFRLLHYYQKCVPLTFMENNVDPSNLIPADILSVSPSILVHLLELLLNLSDFRWSNKSAGTSVSHITTLLTLYLQTPYNHIRNLTAKLVNQTLSDSFMFKHDPEEVQLWLQALPQNFLSRTSSSGSERLTMSTDQEIVLRYLDDCFTRFGKAQYRYTDKLVELVNSTNESFELKISTEKHGHNHISYQSIVDTGSSNTMIDYTHPFSPLLLVLLEQLRFIKTDKRPLVLFISRLFSLLQTKQKLPIYLQALMKSLLETTMNKNSEENDMDLDYNVSDEALVGTWEIKDMVYQAKICLDQEIFSSVSFVTKDQDSETSILTSMISETEIDDDLDNRQKRFIDILDSLPTKALANHLDTTANYCIKVLQFTAFDPLVNYISDRHPVAGNLFDYPNLQHLRSLNDQSPIVDLLKCIPYHIIFYNAWNYSGDHTLAIQLLEHQLNNMTRYQLTCALSLVLQNLSIVLINKATENTMKAIDFCFELIQHGLWVIDNNMKQEQTRLDLRHFIFEHPTLKYFIRRLSTLLHQLRYTDTYPTLPDDDLIQLAVKFTKIFGDGTRTTELLNSMALVDFTSLYKYCNHNGYQSFYNGLMKLLISLIKNGGNQVSIPGKVFATIAQMWNGTHQSAATMGLSNTDVLSLLEKNESLQYQDDDYRNAQRLLLNACSDLVVKHILQGHPYSVNMKDLQEACKETSVPVSLWVLDTFSSSASLSVTVPLIHLIRIGYSLSINNNCSSTDGESYLQTVMESILKMLTENADVSIVSNMAITDDVYDALTLLISQVDDFDWTRLDAEIVRDFVLMTLLDNISNSAAIRFTSTLIHKVYAKYTRKEPIETYIRRILDHNLYRSLTAPKTIDSLLKNKEGLAQTDADDDDADENKRRNTVVQDEQRNAIIELLGTLNDIQPSILASHHGLLDTLLTSYSATTLPSDRRILGILRSSEHHGDQTILPKLLMWGPNSDKTRQEHAQAGTLLRASTISVETLGLIHREMMRYTFLHMPTTTVDKSVVTYDPDFFLPLFANLIASGTLDCRRFIENDGLGLTVAALSSLDENVRKIGYQMMDQFYVLLEHSKFKGKFPIKYLLDIFKQGITKRSDMDVPPRIPPAVCLCVAQSLSILMLPYHFMLPYISKWLSQKPALDFNHIPMFTALFNSTTPNHKKERLWILQVLASSIRTVDDFNIYARHRIWDLIPSYYNSSLADIQSKRLVMELIQQAVSIPDVALRLVQRYGLLTWIHQLLITSTSDERHYLKLILDELQKTMMVVEHQSQLEKDGIIETNSKISEQVKLLLPQQLALLQSLI